MININDNFICPECKTNRKVTRRLNSFGKIVPTWCYNCGKYLEIKVKPMKSLKFPS